MSAAGFGKVTGLAAATGFAVAADFGGIGLGGASDKVSAFVSGCREGEAVPELPSSTESAASTVTDVAGSVGWSSLPAVGLEMDFSEVINDPIDRPRLSGTGSAFMWERLSAHTDDVNGSGGRVTADFDAQRGCLDAIDL